MKREEIKKKKMGQESRGKRKEIWGRGEKVTKWKEVMGGGKMEKVT